MSVSDKRVIFTLEGVVHVVIPSPKCTLTIEELQAIGLRLDSKIAESCFSEVNKGIQNAAAQQAFSPVVPVVSRSVYLRCVRKGFFKYIKTIHLLMLAVIF